MAEENRCEPGTLRVGAAQVDITPSAGVHLSGAVGAFRPARMVLDPLYAKALVLERDGHSLCLVVLDLTIVTGDWTARIRQAASERFGLPPEAVMVHVTQTHSAPSLGDFMVDRDFDGVPSDKAWLRGGDPQYYEYAFARVIEAMELAHAGLQPVRMRVGRGIEGRLAFNRRAVMDDGRVRMPGPRWEDPLGPTYIRYLEGPIDPEVGIACFQTESLETVAALLHYTCHPVNVFPKPIVSADWPGAWSNEVRRVLGGGCVPLVINGCCGNINPWDPFDPAYRPDHHRMGRILAETARNVLETLPVDDDASLDCRARRVAIPIREVDGATLGEAEQTLSKSPEPLPSETNPGSIDHEWVKAASIMSVHLQRQRESAYDYEVQVFRVGKAAIVGLPGEPFVEGQLRIKMASPADLTCVAHCAGHYLGYLPTQEAFSRGGHEVETRYWSKLIPEALDMVVDNAGALLREVFPA